MRQSLPDLSSPLHCHGIYPDGIGRSQETKKKNVDLQQRQRVQMKAVSEKAGRDDEDGRGAEPVRGEKKGQAQQLEKQERGESHRPLPIGEGENETDYGNRYYMA